MSIPTKGEEFAKLIEHLRLAQECMAMLAHVYRDESAITAKGWLAWSEMMGNIVIQTTKFAKRGLQ